MWGRHACVVLYLHPHLYLDVFCPVFKFMCTTRPDKTLHALLEPTSKLTLELAVHAFVTQQNQGVSSARPAITLHVWLSPLRTVQGRPLRFGV